MTQQEKLQGLEKWLDENKIKYDKPKEDELGLTVEQPRIRVFAVEPDDEQSWYEAACLDRCKAFFIRDNESMDFIIGKMRNCLKGKTMARLQKEAGMGKTKRKRVRIPRAAFEKIKP